MKRQLSKWEKITANEATDKGLVSKNIKAAHTAQFRKTNSPIKKWAEDLNRHLFKKDIQMANKPEEKMLTATHY